MCSCNRLFQGDLGFCCLCFFALEEGLEEGGEVVRSLEPSMEEDMEDIVGEVGIVVAVEAVAVTDPLVLFLN